MNFLLLVCTSFIAAALGKESRIVGGEFADIQEFPHQAVFILISLDQVVCGGSIISNWHILTAGNCMYQKEEFLPNVRVFTGTTNISTRRGDGNTIFKVHVHPSFTGEISPTQTGYHDIAIVKLSSPIEFNEYQNKIDMPDNDIIPGNKAFISGWGYLDLLNKRLATVLQKAEMLIVGPNLCQMYHRTPISKTQFCTKHAGLTAGSCVGDGGGPVTFDGKLIGVISVTIPCAQGIPDVHTNVFYYRNFIKSILKKDGIVMQ